jgi:hypothetical protein
MHYRRGKLVQIIRKTGPKDHTNTHYSIRHIVCARYKGT